MPTPSLLPVSALRLHLHPRQRPEVLDLRPRLDEAVASGSLGDARRILCLSHHTTAGFLNRGLRQRVGRDPERLRSFLEALGGVFPPEAGYEHDRLHLRHELTEDQKACEPLNADAHLAFIGGGFTNCAVLDATASSPVWFVDFDGVYEDRKGQPIHRVRRATAIGFRREETVARVELPVPVPSRAGVVRLDDPALGLYEQAEALAEREGVAAGRLRVRLADPAPGVGITVNEFEALLMERDVTRVLENPLDFAREGALALTRAIEALGVPGRRLGRLLDRVLAHPATRVLRMQTELSLGLLAPELVPTGDVPSGEDDTSGTSLPLEAQDGPATGAAGTRRREAVRPDRPSVSPPLEPPVRVLRGTYQSPILVQHAGGPGNTRMLQVSITRFS